MNGNTSKPLEGFFSYFINFIPSMAATLLAMVLTLLELKALGAAMCVLSLLLCAGGAARLARVSRPAAEDTPSAEGGGEPEDELASLRTENLDLEKALLQQEVQLRELVVEKLLRGSFNDDDSREEALWFHQISLVSEYFCVVAVRIVDISTIFFDQPRDHRDHMQARLIIRSVFEEMFGEKHGCQMTLIDGETVFLLNLSGVDGDALSASFDALSEQLRGTAEDGVRFILDNFSLRLTACISAPVKGLAQVPQAFRTVWDIHEYSMSISDPPPVLSLKDFPDYTATDGDIHRALTVEKQYLNALITYDFDTACQLTLDRIDEQLQNCINGFKGLKPFIENRMETTSNLLSINYDAVIVDGKSAADDLTDLLASSELDTIKALLRELYRKLDCHFNKTDSDVGGTAGKVMKYVRANYSNPSLSVETICDELGKSRSYLSRMFKENVGMNLLDYLHTTRITEAKKLLTDTTLSIAEIGEQVGYYSGWTLARVFKRYEGITPSAYRDAYRSSPASQKKAE